ncbi:centromere protein V-like [Littorina saxatilis]|uniref:CENP-V/GFA domain-containing protein n=1 Tax=Littorina saxatilis TaxID=31220 RepID=A0AAN9AK29_9CAEN
MEEVCHMGGCHCGAVRFRVYAPRIIKAIDCNCSICKKKQNIHFIVPESKFELIKGQENLTTYTFNTGVAKHTFCKICGVQSFYRPRSNPDGYGVMPHCLDQGTVERVDIEKFEGEQWEQNIVSSDIASRSKVN